jgi:putative cell wall-binding protein
VTPSRSWGANRYDTAEALTRAAWSSGTASTVWVASGQTFQDALIASAAAAVRDEPFVLVNGAGVLSTGQSSLFSTLRPSMIKVVAAPGTMSSTLIQQLQALGSVTMYEAADPSVRSASVWADRSTKGPVVLATSLNFPDALSAVVFTAHGTETPLFLVPGTCVPASTKAEIQRLSSGRLRIIGGPAAVGLGVENLTTCP